MKKREKIGYMYLIDTDELIAENEFPEDATVWDYWVTAAYLPN